MASLANISQVTLAKLERGQMVAVSIKTLDIIFDALGYEIGMERKDKQSFGIPVFGEMDYILFGKK